MAKLDNNLMLLKNVVHLSLSTNGTRLWRMMVGALLVTSFNHVEVSPSVACALAVTWLPSISILSAISNISHLNGLNRLETLSLARNNLKVRRRLAQCFARIHPPNHTNHTGPRTGAELEWH